jgi:hypothetical protein
MIKTAIKNCQKFTPEGNAASGSLTGAAAFGDPSLHHVTRSFPNQGDSALRGERLHLGIHFRRLSP